MDLKKVLISSYQFGVWFIWKRVKIQINGPKKFQYILLSNKEMHDKKKVLKKNNIYFIVKVSMHAPLWECLLLRPPRVNDSWKRPSKPFNDLTLNGAVFHLLPIDHDYALWRFLWFQAEGGDFDNFTTVILQYFHLSSVHSVEHLQDFVPGKVLIFFFINCILSTTSRNMHKIYIQCNYIIYYILIFHEST